MVIRSKSPFSNPQSPISNIQQRTKGAWDSCARDSVLNLRDSPRHRKYGGGGVAPSVRPEADSPEGRRRAILVPESVAHRIGGPANLPLRRPHCWGSLSPASSGTYSIVCEPSLSHADRFVNPQRFPMYLYLHERICRLAGILSAPVSEPFGLVIRDGLR